MGNTPAENAFAFLDTLRESGTTNMVGATGHLYLRYGFTRKTSKKLLTAWMHTFSSSLTVGERVATADERDLLPNVIE